MIEQFLNSNPVWPLFALIAGVDDIFIMLALMVFSAVLQALTTKAPPKPQDAVASTIGDFNLPEIKEGTAQTVVFGDVWLNDWQVLWYGNLRAEPITKSSGGGKK